MGVPMSKLFKNAVSSIVVGIEDYRSNSQPRALSAVRNFYAATLLLAKEVLARQAPNASLNEILGAKYKPKSDGAGGVKFVPADRTTVDFRQLAERLKDFGISISDAELKYLNRIRNDIEHLYTDASHDAVREAIAKAFPIVVKLFRSAKEEPHELLGDAWQTMLEVRSLYESELEQCEKSFENVDWGSDVLTEAPKLCPDCNSHLIEQINPANTDFQSIEAKCRACGERIGAEKLVETAIDEHLSLSHRDLKHGAEPVHTECHECGLKTFVLRKNRCVWCDATLGRCSVCDEPLTPDNVDFDNDTRCSYHGYVMSKDD
jgi:hypothetical protein